MLVNKIEKQLKLMAFKKKYTPDFEWGKSLLWYVSCNLAASVLLVVCIKIFDKPDDDVFPSVLGEIFFLFLCCFTKNSIYFFNVFSVVNCFKIYLQEYIKYFLALYNYYFIFFVMVLIVTILFWQIYVCFGTFFSSSVSS